MPKVGCAESHVWNGVLTLLIEVVPLVYTETRRLFIGRSCSGYMIGQSIRPTMRKFNSIQNTDSSAGQKLLHRFAGISKFDQI